MSLHFSLDEPSVQQAQVFTRASVNPEPRGASRFASGHRKEDKVPPKSITATFSCKAKVLKGPCQHAPEYAIYILRVSFVGSFPT